MTVLEAQVVHHRVRLSSLRQRTGAHMLHSVATSPHASISVEVDYHGVDQCRDAHGPQWKIEHGRSLTYLPFVVRALCTAIAAFPEVNSSLDGPELVVFDRVNVGIAVDLGHRGLIVPVIEDAHTRSVAELAVQIADLADRARSKKLRPEEVSGGTYTVTNPGPFGTYCSAPIISQPQTAILAVDGVAKRPVVMQDEAGQEHIVIRPVGLITQTFDHRAFDGAYCAAFLKRLAATLATSDWSAIFTAPPIPDPKEQP